ncbi:MAG: cytochrome c3 family protein [Georgfuchsia sp.]
MLAIVGIGITFAQGTADSASSLPFNHTSTGFPLTDFHARARCESCHVQGIFRGTPRDCATCHRLTGQTTADRMPVTHIPTNLTCDTCHRTSGWTPAMFTHQGVVTGTCATCHNGVTTAGKPPTHMQTANSCDACHKTTAWTPAGYDHVNITPGSCITCHNGVKATGKPVRHIPTSAACDTCHARPPAAIAFAPTSMNHDGLSGQCSTCHNGSYLSSNAQAKPATHVGTNAQCDTCHISTTTWATANFDHNATSTPVPGNCSACHNSTNALGKPTNHIATTAQCDICHNNFIAFTPAVMSHTGTTGPVTAGNCSTCHDGTKTFANAEGKSATHIPTSAQCDSCHNNNVSWTPSPMNHTGTEGNCITCHGGNYLGANAQAKPPTHVTTSAQCDTCHKSDTTWATAIFDHSAASPTPAGNCSTCHNSTNALGKPVNHIPTNTQCDACHNNFVAFAPSVMNHSDMAGKCSTCHNGSYLSVNALTKPISHIPNPSAAISQCDTCHVNGFIAFAPAQMNHSGMAGYCDKCHNGSFIAVNAQWKPPTHIATTAQCDTCHKSNITWATATFDHAAATTPVAGNCSTCHNGTNALGKATNHFPTTAQCDTCHVGYAAFAPATMSHTGTTGPTSSGNCSTCHGGGFTAQNAQAKPATHLPTTLQCDTCHTTTVWKPNTYAHQGVTSGTCATCHNGATALGKPSGHIPTTAQCDMCHNNFIAFAPGKMDHAAAIGPVSTGNCSTCHSGAYINVNAQTKPATHVSTTAQCDTCHNSTSTWATAVFNHDSASPPAAGNCSACHNGTNALGKPTNHIPGSAQCDTCHNNFVTFAPAVMNHSAAAGQCASCHNGGYLFANALAKPVSHIPTTDQCDTCHISGFVAFTPATMNHTGKTGQCSSCHGGAYIALNALAKPPTHLVTTAQCDSCHNTAAWTPAVFSHTGVVSGSCANCHNGTNALGKNVSHIPTTKSCDVCHAGYAAFAPGIMNHDVTSGPIAAGNCSTCHSGTYLAVNAQAKPPTHVATTAQCDTCHKSTATWATATYAHDTSATGQCSTCHNSTTALGKPSNHIPTASQCDTCHKSFGSFAGLGQMNHAGTTGPVATSNCSTCHISTYSYANALAMTASHIPTSLQCDTCHKNNVAFAPATMDHTGTTGQCSTCHGGIYTAIGAQARPVTHLPTAQQCDICHLSTTAWLPASYNHAAGDTNCSTCHNGTTAMGKSALHIPTTAECSACHNNHAVFAPALMNHASTTGPVAASNCTSCHSGSYISVNAQTKTPTHVSTTAQCDTCHNSTTTWATAMFNHATASPPVTAICSTCHNGTAALGKPSNHVPTASQCDTCHKNFVTFTGTGQMNHAGTSAPVSAANCSTCHNGAYLAMNALSKPASHIPTSAQCDTCHKNYVAFAPAVMDHAGTGGQCANCHNGTYTSVNAQTKPGSHLPTSQSCDGCHTTTAWIPTSFTHSGVAPGSCATCHNGVNATGKVTPHIPTSQSCDSCHRTGISWMPLLTPYAHTGIATGSCSSCHDGGYTSIDSKTNIVSNHVPTTVSCDSCHATTSWVPNKTYNHTGYTVGTRTCSTCHGSTSNFAGVVKPPSNHFPDAVMSMVGGSQCDICHTSTTSFTVEKMQHGSIQTGCAMCHDRTTPYLTGSAKKMTIGSHEKSKAGNDCSMSGCHKPLGSKGNPYTKWD